MNLEHRTITINDTSIAYTIKRSRRRRRSMALGVTHQGLSVMVPWRESYGNVERLITHHAAWIIKKLAQLQEYSHVAPPHALAQNPEIKHHMVNEHRARAAIIFNERVEFYQNILGVKHSGLKIGNQKSRWGSCNRRGVISLNWRLILLPMELLDYVVVHELCHLVHLNHSTSFWRLVETVLPDYQHKRKTLRKMMNVFAW